MAIDYDIETAVETAISGLLTEEGLNAMRWDDKKDLRLSRVTKIKANLVDEEYGTMNTYAASRVVVDIASFDSKKRDTQGIFTNTDRGTVRQAFDRNNTDLSGSPESRLSGFTSAVYFYDNGINTYGTFDASDGKNWGKGISFVIHCKIFNPDA